MHWRQTLVVPLCVLGIVLGGNGAHEQVPFAPSCDCPPQGIHSTRPWDARLSTDATGNLVFQSLASLLQVGPNSKHNNGHSIVRASIPEGTLLYHGRANKEPPTRDWIALDSEHSQFFAAGANGTLFTFTTTRELQFLYFDGCSANKFDGVVDTQDVLFWDEVDYDPQDDWFAELARMDRMCEWGQQYGIDGIVRMQYNFEIMYCDVWNGGLQLISTASLVATDGMIFANPRKTTSTPSTLQDTAGVFAWVLPSPIGRLPPAPREPMIPPEGWKGSLPTTAEEVIHTGAWHNAGEVRIQVDPSTMISFYDPALTSLVEARRLSKRKEYRLAGISKEDVSRVQADVAEMMNRDPSAKSGVDWQALARVIQDWFSDRLPYIHHFLHQPFSNASAQAVIVRRAIYVSLLPYMGRDNVGTPDWYAHMAEGCATRYIAHLPMAKFTKQEYLLHNAIQEVLHEICRVYTVAWRDAFDVEEQSAHSTVQLLVKWRGEFDALIEWLDWPAWMKCDPPCGADEFCRWSQYAVWESDPKPEPRCISVTTIKF
ncbi:hypothetical protein DAEQUDRAFT_685254 [Daedalea quercina L-15889]|uniref:Uncharacterized protein n=1 Tax=Daedalea quercina L-15889 TaxID=1314783 RepID=A0A165T3U9_9APHY|nr:hypothetical protein DAEQUDRAFT_685254 [Daedalea quercina L-15889]